MIDFTTVLVDFDDKPVQHAVVGQDGKVTMSNHDLTLAMVALNALGTTHDDERGLSGEDKVKRGALALRIHKEGSLELTSDEITLVKKLIAKIYGPMVVLRTWALLDPASVK